MTQRKLTAPELTAINTVYRQAGFIRDLIENYVSTEFFPHLADMHDHQTSDGKPLTPIERVPTAADIGKSVKVRDYATDGWVNDWKLAGFLDDEFVVVKGRRCFSTWNLCIIDQEAEE